MMLSAQYVIQLRSYQKLDILRLNCEPFSNKFTQQLKSEASTAVFYTSNNGCLKQLHRETSNSEVKRVQYCS